MNQDQVKDTLLSLEIPAPDFDVIFSGKASNKVNGLYKPGDRTILIHNRNFKDDNAMMVTAIHEFVHHIADSRGLVTTTRSHPVIFWALFHSVLGIATQKGIYTDPYLTDPELVAKKKEIQKILASQVELQLSLGKALVDMQGLSIEKGARYEDFLDRHARIPRPAAEAAVSAQLEFNLEGIKENATPQAIELIASCGDFGSEAASRIADGESLQQVKAACKQHKVIDPRLDRGDEETNDQKLDRLKKKRDNLNSLIIRQRERLEAINTEIQSISGQFQLPLSG